MDDIELARKNLDIILKKGDLYDVIAQKEGVRPSKYPFLKLNIFLLSRILYAGVFINDRIKSHFIPIKKIKASQEEIRKILGFNVDIIRSKKQKINKFGTKEKPHLSLLYEEEDIEREEYIENLKKILEFCKLHSIDEIFLSTKLVVLLPTSLKGYIFKDASISDIIDEYIVDHDDYRGLQSFNCIELQDLIKRLEIPQVNKNFISELKDQIQDKVIKKEINQFLANKNMEKLKRVVNARLTLILNSESVYKDKIHGKVYEEITIHEKYVKVISRNQKEGIISSNMMTLYDYLDIPNNKVLMEEIKRNSDNKEILLITTLYLHLYGHINNNNNKTKKTTGKEITTFYDKIYNRFEEKRKHKIKKIKSMHAFDYKLVKDVVAIFQTAYRYLKLLSFILIPFMSMKLMQKEKVTFNTITTPYKKSLELEKELGKKLIYKIADKIKEIDINLDRLRENVSTGDTSNKNSEDEEITIAKIKKLNQEKNKDFQLPVYYANGYAPKAAYQNGKVNYTITNPDICLEELKNVEELFQVSFGIEQVQSDRIRLPQILYPLGDNYVLTRIDILDKKDKNKKITIDSKRDNNLGDILTEEEFLLLKSMSNPIMRYTYGINKNIENPFVTKLEKTSTYTNLSQEKIKESIICGLELNSDASIEEILKKIKNKTYSKTPIEDAGLSNKIQDLTEEEYYEAIASLDSLICNLASSLAVATDEELIYVIGYMNTEDETVITKNESHAWAMNKEGTIIDVTPSIAWEEEKEENDNNDALLKNTTDILGWIIKIEAGLVFIYIGLSLKESFEEKFIPNFNRMKAKRILTIKDIENSYTKINETLYGGINIPKKLPPGELAEKIAKEFAGFSKEELKELKKEIKESEFDSKKQLTNALKLIDEIPYIKENQEELQKVLRK